jgi:hypothetical protein
MLVARLHQAALNCVFPFEGGFPSLRYTDYLQTLSETRIGKTWDVSSRVRGRVTLPKATT